MKQVKDLVGEIEDLVRVLAEAEASVATLVRDLWETHSRMGSGDITNGVRERVEFIEGEKVHLKKLVNWIAAAGRLIEQLSPDVLNEDIS